MEQKEKYINNNKKERTEERVINLDDLIAAYYYEALSFQNIFYEKHFEKAVEKLKDKLLIYLENYLNLSTDVAQNRLEKSLYNNLPIFCDLLKQENNPRKIILQINEFIMLLHEKVKSMLGEKVLGFSASEFEALNYIDISKPLVEQREIIFNKIKKKSKD